MPRKNRTPESLALNRENQRRSRARHRELLDDLQRRVRDYERRDGQATLEMQRVARAVAAENAALKGLLAAKGVAPDEIESHLQAARAGMVSPGQSQAQLQMSSQPNQQPLTAPPVAMRDGSTGPMEPRLEPIRELQYDPRLDMPYKVPSPALSVSSSVITSSSSLPSIPVSMSGLLPAPSSISSPPHIAIAPKPSALLHPKPVVPIPRLDSLVSDGPLPPLISGQLEKSQNDYSRRYSRDSLPLPMMLDKPLASISLSRAEHKSSNGPKMWCSKLSTEAKSRPVLRHQILHQHQTLPSISNKMHCVEAANILARLRGHPDESYAMAALGCTKNQDCFVRNTDLLQLMD